MPRENIHISGNAEEQSYDPGAVHPEYHHELCAHSGDSIFCISNNQVSFAFVQESLFPHLNQSSARSESGQSRRFSDVGMSASPPTPDVSLQGNEPTLRANSGREQVQQQGCAVEGAPQLLSDLVGAAGGAGGPEP